LSGGAFLVASETKPGRLGFSKGVADRKYHKGLFDTGPQSKETKKERGAQRGQCTVKRQIKRRRFIWK